MLRYYFVFLLVVGIASSMLTSRHSEAPAHGNERVIALTTEGTSHDRGVDRVEQQMTRPRPILKREWDGHFYPDTQINGTTIRMLVDTGATGIALSRDDARRAGIGIPIGMPGAGV